MGGRGEQSPSRVIFVIVVIAPCPRPRLKSCFFFRFSQLRVAQRRQRDGVADGHAPVSELIPEPGRVQPGQLQRGKRGQTT